MVGVEVPVFLHRGGLQDVFQDVKNPQYLELVEFHLAALWMTIMILQNDMGRGLFIAEHLLPNLNMKRLVSGGFPQCCNALYYMEWSSLHLPYSLFAFTMSVLHTKIIAMKIGNVA